MAVSKVVLNGATLIDTTDKTVTNASMLSGVTALKNDGTTATGNIASKTSSDLAASGATVTAPAGYYAAAASKSVASGTAGTPTATKGAVSNHSVSVTPSVTNTAGYISGGTKTGTAVSVSASELVSGTKTISENGTGIDVTNYASVDVEVPTGEDSVTVEPLSVSQNGTYTAPSGTAYSPVTVNVSGGGNNNLVLLGTDEVIVNTTSTTATTEKTYSIPIDLTLDSQYDGLYLCWISDKAGKRNGYFCSSVGVIYGNTSLKSWTLRITSNGATGTFASGYGVYASAMLVTASDGVTYLNATISSRYNSTYSLTVDGTYSIEFYYVKINSLFLGE